MSVPDEIDVLPGLGYTALSQLLPLVRYAGERGHDGRQGRLTS
jgi:hypothetical protein